MPRKMLLLGFVLSTTLSSVSWSSKSPLTAFFILISTYTTVMVGASYRCLVENYPFQNAALSEQKKIPPLISNFLGVESAFQFTDKVLTVSIHHYAEGFYPGTGSGTPSSARAKATVNIPMLAGLSDGTLSKVFDEMVEPLVKQFSPDAVVLQCGVDGEHLFDFFCNSSRCSCKDC
jgi:hypothetical protein